MSYCKRASEAQVRSRVLPLSYMGSSIEEVREKWFAVVHYISVSAQYKVC